MAAGEWTARDKLRGFEAQVNNTHGDPVKTASIYHIVKNYVPPAKDNEWFTMHVIVQGKHVVVNVNDKKVVDWTERVAKFSEAEQSQQGGTYRGKGNRPRNAKRAEHPRLER